MAEYNVDIQVKASTRQADQEITRLVGKLKKIENVDISTKAAVSNLQKTRKEVDGLSTSFKRLKAGLALGGGATGIAVLAKAVGATGEALAKVNANAPFGIGALHDLGQKAVEATAGVNGLSHGLASIIQHGPATAAALGAAGLAAYAFSDQIAAATTGTRKFFKGLQELAVGGVIKEINGDLQLTNKALIELAKGEGLTGLQKLLREVQQESNNLLSTDIDYRSSVTKTLDVQKAINAEMARRRLIYSNLTTAERALGAQIRQNLRASEAGRAGTGFGAFSQAADSGTAVAKAIRRQRDRLAKRLRGFQFQVPQLALPAFEERGLQNLTDSYQTALDKAQQLQAATRTTTNVADALAANQARGARFTQKSAENAERLSEYYGDDKLTRLTKNVATNNSKAANSEQKTAGFVKNTNKLYKGTLDVTNAQIEAQKQLLQIENEKADALKLQDRLAQKAGKRAESLALGVGFPLLFGGGPGAVAGGALGSFAGQGFGGQIIFSAIGQQIDAVVANIAKLGQALNPLTLDLDAVTAAAGLSGTELERYIKELEDSEGKLRAATEAQKALAVVVGDEGVDALEEFGTATQRLSNAFDRAMSRMAAGVARLINSIPGFLQFTANLEQGAVLQRALASQDPAQAENLRRLQAARVGTGGVDIEKQQSAIAALIRTQRTIEAGGGAKEDMELLNRKLDVAKQQLEVTKAGTDLADIAVYRARQELQAKEHALRITEVMQEDLTDAARNAKFDQLRLQDERERLQLTKDRQAVLDKNAKAGQKQADRISQEVALLNIRNNLTQNMLGIDKQIADAKREGRDADVEALERNKILLQGVAKEAELRVRIKDATLLQAEIRKADLATQAEINKLDGEQADRLADQQKNFDETINRLQLELEGLKGISDTEKDNLRFKEIQLDLLSKDVNLTETKKQQIKDLLADIRSTTNAMSEQEFVQNNINNLVNTAGQQFTGLFQTLINGTNDWNSALRNVLSSLANALLKFGLTSLGGDDGIGLFSILSGTFTGKPKGKALGGQVGAGTSYLVGEKGPELFMPGAKGNIIPNSALGGMGGGSITVNVDAKGSTVEGNGDQANQLGKVIGAAIQQELIKQKKPGGLLA